MKLLAILLICFTTAAQAYVCPVARKNIATEAPRIPGDVVIEEGWSDAFDAVFTDLCRNLKTPDFLFRGYRAHPGPNYKGAYLWDSAFIMQVWMYWDPQMAQRLVDWILKFQTKDGMLPHAIAEIIIKPKRIHKSQPPLLAWASWRVYERSRDKKFLKRVYPGLKRYHEWLMTDRRHPDGLFFWATPYESGIDNSPRFANRTESWMDDTTQLASVDMSSYVATSMEALANMAAVLGITEDQKRFKSQYADLKRVMNEKLWDDKDGTYYDWDYRTMNFVKIHTISNLTPMVAGIPDDFKAARLMRDIMDPARYNTLIPFPTVSRHDPKFEKDMWRGPVWVNTAYLGILGADRYGYREEAAELSYKLVKGVYETWKNTGNFYEFYDPERYDIKELTRKKGNLWKRLTIGRKPVKRLIGWTGLANTLVFEYGEEWSK